MIIIIIIKIIIAIIIIIIIIIIIMIITVMVTISSHKNLSIAFYEYHNWMLRVYKWIAIPKK